MTNVKFNLNSQKWKLASNK